MAAVVHDGGAALQAITALSPDVAFLDVRMPTVSGIDVAREVGGRCHVVFVTAYHSYASPAFEHGALDYLLKPLVAQLDPHQFWQISLSALLGIERHRDGSTEVLLRDRPEHLPVSQAYQHLFRQM